MYNALFGVNDIAKKLLEMLELEVSDFGRFRDAYLSENGEKIIVYTRCGGGNREDYEYVFEEMKNHPNYLTDYDDDFDCTYASIEFSIPEKYKNICKELCENSDTTTGEEKWNILFKSLEGEQDNE